jgi:hypothetical protein
MAHHHWQVPAKIVRIQKNTDILTRIPIGSRVIGPQEEQHSFRFVSFRLFAKPSRTIHPLYGTIK